MERYCRDADQREGAAGFKRNLRLLGFLRAADSFLQFWILQSPLGIRKGGNLNYTSILTLHLLLTFLVCCFLSYHYANSVFVAGLSIQFDTFRAAWAFWERKEQKIRRKLSHNSSVVWEKMKRGGNWGISCDIENFHALTAWELGAAKCSPHYCPKDLIVTIFL